MAIQINNSYQHIYSNAGIVGNSSKSSMKASAGTSYLNKLSQKFPSINFIEGTYRKGTMFGFKDKCNIMISPVLLQKMDKDSELASKIEQIIRDIPREEEIFRAKCASRGMHVESSGTIIDANGQVSSYCYTTRKMETPSDHNKKEKDKVYKKHDKKLDEELYKELQKELQKTTEENIEENIQKENPKERQILKQYHSSQFYGLNSSNFFEKR